MVIAHNGHDKSSKQSNKSFLAKLFGGFDMGTLKIKADETGYKQAIAYSWTSYYITMMLLYSFFHKNQEQIQKK